MFEQLDRRPAHGSRLRRNSPAGRASNLPPSRERK
jgi:hypothetical protein